MNIIEKRTAEIIPYANNPRNNETAVDAVAASISEFGFKQPIVIDKKNVVVAGHTRLMAAKKLNLETVPCVMADDLTEAQVKAYRLADNKVGELATWDFEKLELEMNDLDMDMEQFGFEELKSDANESVNIEEDEVPDTVEKRCKLGDVWDFGGVHRLICGDSTDANVIDKLLDGTKANMVFTDPPYGYNYQSNMRTKTQKFNVLVNDDKILDFFPNLIGRVTGFVMICTTWKVLNKWISLFEQYFELSNMIIWDKGGGGIGDLKHTFATDYEVILCAHNGAEIKEKRIGSVWDIGKDNANDYKHPTQKPVELSANAIRHTTETGEIVLDVFGGSGSTLMACEQLKRKCYICELDEHYCDVILQRWENFTGQKAVLVE